MPLCSRNLSPAEREQRGIIAVRVSKMIIHLSEYSTDEVKARTVLYFMSKHKDDAWYKGALSKLNIPVVDYMGVKRDFSNSDYVLCLVDDTWNKIQKDLVEDFEKMYRSRDRRSILLALSELVGSDIDMITEEAIESKNKEDFRRYYEREISKGSYYTEEELKAEYENYMTWIGREDKDDNDVLSGIEME